ncbi:NAD(P)H-binding protein [Flavobacterium aquicola]|uniref:Putative NAD(P)-binding protein n=1 Tax=Flavobacterium aquicola TaxID=1682742 RepID=A0A3E0EMM6_9FLAO|nr:NAD(P)H-binding protein [Flavobacterium aquicola]REG99477.1 putative NAD(P)-binding protein [Flavobacterium aquicola]
MLTDDLLAQTNYNLELYARNANARLTDSERIKIVDGDFNDEQPLFKAMEGVDVVNLNDMNDYDAIKNILAVIKKHNVKRIITASIIDIYGKANFDHLSFIEHLAWKKAVRDEEYDCCVDKLSLIEKRFLNFEKRFQNTFKLVYMSSLKAPFMYNENAENICYLMIDQGISYEGYYKITIGSALESKSVNDTIIAANTLVLDLSGASIFRNYNDRKTEVSILFKKALLQFDLLEQFGPLLQQKYPIKDSKVRQGLFTSFARIRSEAFSDYCYRGELISSLLFELSYTIVKTMVLPAFYTCCAN